MWLPTSPGIKRIPTPPHDSSILSVMLSRITAKSVHASSFVVVVKGHLQMIGSPGCQTTTERFFGQVAGTGLPSSSEISCFSSRPDCQPRAPRHSVGIRVILLTTISPRSFACCAWPISLMTMTSLKSFTADSSEHQVFTCTSPSTLPKVEIPYLNIDVLSVDFRTQPDAKVTCRRHCHLLVGTVPPSANPPEDALIFLTQGREPPHPQIHQLL